MTNEEKQLLLKDLCARLPYGVIISYQVGKLTPVNRVFTGKAFDELMCASYVDEWIKCSFKPYLRPISSMTEEEKKEYNYLTDCSDYMIYSGAFCNAVVDWLNAHHFDYHGLIEKNLALKAPVDMYKNK